MRALPASAEYPSLAITKQVYVLLDLSRAVNIVRTQKVLVRVWVHHESKVLLCKTHDGKYSMICAEVPSQWNNATALKAVALRHNLPLKQFISLSTDVAWDEASDQQVVEHHFQALDEGNCSGCNYCVPPCASVATISIHRSVSRLLLESARGGVVVEWL